MSKEPHHDLPPPPYAASPTTSHATNSSSPAYTHSYPSFTTNLATHLATVSARLRESYTARATVQARSDLDLVERLVPHVESFLADVVFDPNHRRAELTLVPAISALSPSWSLTGAGERRAEGELVHVARVAVPSSTPDPLPSKDSKGRRVVDDRDVGDSKGSGIAGLPPPTSSSLRPERDWSSSQFDSWGRWDEDAEAAAAGGGGSEDAYWWRDETMARRLAAYLQPAPAYKTARREVQTAVVQAREEKRSGWGWGRKKGSASSPTQVIAAVPKEPEERVKMVVKAHDVTFRRENDFGVWESTNGWGIVVVVTTRPMCT